MGPTDGPRKQQLSAHRRQIGRRRGRRPRIQTVSEIGGELPGDSQCRRDLPEFQRIPGIGRLALQAITNRDYALLQGTILFVATGFIVINLIVDLLYAFINPKVRF